MTLILKHTDQSTFKPTQRPILPPAGIMLPLQVLTWFSCPAGRFLTVPVTLMTDSVVKLHNTAFRGAADFKQRQQMFKAEFSLLLLVFVVLYVPYFILRN